MLGGSGGSCKRASNDPTAGPARKEKPPDNTGNADEFSVRVKGVKRSMRLYNPIEINRNLHNFLGGKYKDIKVLTSGDLLVKCKDGKQMNKLLKCDNLGDESKPIEIRVEVFKTKPAEIKGVISGVPVELSEEEIKQSLAGQLVSYVKRFPYRTEKGVMQSRSVLLCFTSRILPPVVDIGYLRFRTRPYIPPPKRCFNCNRYGHLAKQCRSAHRCTKCGGRHLYEKCDTNMLKCVNCGGAHSAGYAGCPRYRQESLVNSIMVKENVNYWKAREKVRATSVQTINLASHDEFPSLPHRQKSNKPTKITNFESCRKTESLGLNDNGTGPESVSPETKTYSNNGYATEQITIPKESFFVFIAEVIKNTLLTFSENKHISIEKIIAKSAAENLGIPLMWSEDSDEPSAETNDDEQSPMDLSQYRESQTS